MKPGGPGKGRLRPFLRRVFRTLERTFAMAGVVLVTYYVGFDLSVIVSGSMSPALQGTSIADGDWVLTERVSYWFREPRRWEVVALQKADGMKVMKRIVGLPGEAVSLKDSCVLINGEATERPASLGYLKYYAYGNLARKEPVTCGLGYYVLGDDSKDSEDSRFEGPAKRGQVYGRAWLRVWPLSRIGFVSP